MSNWIDSKAPPPDYDLVWVCNMNAEIHKGPYLGSYGIDFYQVQGVKFEVTHWREIDVPDLPNSQT